ncbi:MAG TPA: hypothetical protein VF017_11875 [Thermoanaerobaculia bacterium]|nr:hypothetical protein [Thermoanaerobaculia bacterium]
MKILSTRLLLLLLAVVGMLSLSAAPASALPCDYYPWETCVECCDGNFEHCIDLCGINPTPSCINGCFTRWSNCQAGCIVDPLASLFLTEPTFTPVEKPTPAC